MAWRSRGGGLGFWAAILAVYALLLHAPAMAAMGHAGDHSVMAASGEDHGDHAAAEGGAGDSPSAENLCCIVCSGGPCAAGPVGTNVIALPLPLARARRMRLPLQRRQLRQRVSSWFEARGPPAAA